MLSTKPKPKPKALSHSNRQRMWASFVTQVDPNTTPEVSFRWNFFQFCFISTFFVSIAFRFFVFVVATFLPSLIFHGGNRNYCHAYTVCVKRMAVSPCLIMKCIFTLFPISPKMFYTNCYLLWIHLTTNRY